MKRFFFIVTMISVCAGLIWTSWLLAYNSQLRSLQGFGRIRLDQILGQFSSEAIKYRILPTLIARQSAIIDQLTNGTVDSDGEGYLFSTLHMTNSSEIRLLKPDGSVVLSARKDSNPSPQGTLPADQPHFQEALSGSLGFHHIVDEKNRVRSFNFARSILDRNSQTLGVVTVEADVEQIEFELRGIPETILFADHKNRIFLSNRSEMIYRVMKNDHKAPAELADFQNAFAPKITEPVKNIVLWKNTLGTSDRNTYLVVAKPVPLYKMNATLLVNTQPARDFANLLSALVASLLVAAAIAAYALDLRRRRLIEKLDLEQDLNRILEQRILQRTNELETAQSRLVEAAKMSALGKMSAGIGHELNQPIASIQNFSVNAKKFLERGNVEAVESNLAEIEDLTQRMNKIIGNLRSFARNEKIEIFEVDLNEIINVAVQLSRPRLKNESISLKMDVPDLECTVKGGQVRLQQVLVNLISNAADAVAASSQKRVEIKLERGADITTLSVRDTGTGIEDISKVFEPFYTTKAVDEGHGLGLGLSISYSIVRSFGGTIIAENHAEGGAIFRVILQNVPGNISGDISGV